MTPALIRSLSPAALYPALLTTTRDAIACGALQGIDTQQIVIRDAGVRFLLRSVSSLRHKATASQRRRGPGDGAGADQDPFLPPEPELTLGAISPTHIAVLNKFNVLEHHLLIVTRVFEHQETLLTRADFNALWLALHGIDGLGFYNGGAQAGASQSHKHLQLVPLPLEAEGPGLPMEALMQGQPGTQTLTRLPGLRFRHAFRPLPSELWQHPERAADFTQGLYRDMLKDCGIQARTAADGECQSLPYNLLLRRQWMLLVPRSREHWAGISVNALGYAGSLFVRNEDELARVRNHGPMRLLEDVALPLS